MLAAHSAGAALRAVLSGLGRPRGRGAPRLLGPSCLAAVVVTLAGTFTATAYGPPWGGIQGTGTTATGVKLAPAPTPTMNGPYIVAVDPSVIPLGTKLKINPNPFGNPNIVFTAADTGGAIKGTRLDFYDPRGRPAQMAWGSRPVAISALPSATINTAGAASSQGSSSSPWVRLLVELGLVGLGGAFIYLGGRRAIGARAQ